MDFKPLQRATNLYFTLGENHMTKKHKLKPAIN